MKQIDPAELAERTLSSERHFAGRVFQVDVTSVALADGNLSQREIVRHSGGAAVVALDASGRVCLVSQFRAPFERVTLEIPAGKLEPEENPLCCAQRELTEETGFAARRWQLLAESYPSPGYCGERIYIYLARDLKAGRACPDQGELIAHQLMPLEQALQLVDQGRIKDAKTIIGLLQTARVLQQEAQEEA